MSKNKKSFVKGAAILGAAGILVKILGAFFKIPLGNIVSDSATSYFQTAYPVYNLLLVISTAGLPSAIARIVSVNNAHGRHRENDRVLKVMSRFMFCLGLLGSFIMFFGSDFLSHIIGNPNAATSFKALSFALVFVSYMSAYRGYFQGISELKNQIISLFGQYIRDIYHVPI